MTDTTRNFIDRLVSGVDAVLEDIELEEVQGFGVGEVVLPENPTEPCCAFGHVLDRAGMLEHISRSGDYWARVCNMDALRSLAAANEVFMVPDTLLEAVVEVADANDDYGGDPHAVAEALKALKSRLVEWKEQLE